MKSSLQRALEDVRVDYHFDVCPYSGSFMTNGVCLGIVGDDLDLFNIGVAVAKVVSDEVRFLPPNSIERMGHRGIAYWPSIHFEESVL
jgi:hypothetical protein